METNNTLLLLAPHNEADIYETFIDDGDFKSGSSTNHDSQNVNNNFDEISKKSTNEEQSQSSPSSTSTSSSARSSSQLRMRKNELNVSSSDKKKAKTKKKNETQSNNDNGIKGKKRRTTKLNSVEMEHAVIEKPLQIISPWVTLDEVETSIDADVPECRREMIQFYGNPLDNLPESITAR